MSFNFNFFGRSYFELCIYTNGYVEFDDYNSIYALYYDLDTTESGGIYYQNLETTSNDFNLIKSDINRLNSAFNPANLFRITYDNVPASRKNSFTQDDALASFQIILATNGSSSYVLLKYTSCIYLSSSYKQPGFYHKFENGQEFSPNQFSNPCDSSNVNLTGTWVFLSGVSNGTVIFFSQIFFYLYF
jgi:hypothetical protein